VYLDSGHAFEARIYAENVPRGFLPATGTLYHYRPVPSGPTGNFCRLWLTLLPVIIIWHDLTYAWSVRVETGVEQGDAVSMHYDPMIAKLVVWSESRSAALVKLKNCLSNFQVYTFHLNWHIFLWWAYSRIRCIVAECVYGSLFQEVRFCLVFWLYRTKSAAHGFYPSHSHFLLTIPNQRARTLIFGSSSFIASLCFFFLSFYSPSFPFCVSVFIAFFLFSVWFFYHPSFFHFCFCLCVLAPMGFISSLPQLAWD
jgi:hypothetical protein